MPRKVKERPDPAGMTGREEAGRRQMGKRCHSRCQCPGSWTRLHQPGASAGGQVGDTGHRVDLVPL